VVADEVHKLAGRSAQSADQITESLTAIRNDIDTTLAQMQGGLMTLATGSEKAQRAKGALAVIEQSAARTRAEIERVVADSSRNARLAREIGAKAQQAAQQVLSSKAGAREVAAGSGKAQGAVQNVAAIAGETAALAGSTQRLMSEGARTTARVKRSVEGLAGLADELQRATARFRV
jgi:methyl-accepting chemotaxis protein